MIATTARRRFEIILLGLVSALAVFLFAAPAFAQAGVRFVIGARYWYAGDQKQAMDVAPVIIHDRTYVPVRYLAQALGVDPGMIFWQSADRTVALVAGNTAVKLTVGNQTAYVNGTPLVMDVAPLLVPPGRVMLPARAVAQALGWQVGWQSAAQTVIVYPREVAVAAGGVNVRQQPATTAPVLTTLAKGTLLAVTGASATWLQVTLPSGGSGWIAGYLVEKAAVPAADPSSPSRGETTAPAPGTTGVQGTAPDQSTSPPPGGDSPVIRVSLAQGLNQVSFSPNAPGQLLDAAGNRVLTTLAPGQNRTVTASPAGMGVTGVAGTSQNLMVQASGTTASTPFLVSLQAGTIAHSYRGTLVLQFQGGLINVYDQLPMEQYLYGVVPSEMSPSAPAAALAAQAVAARTYAFAHLTAAAGYAVLDPGASQTYGGHDAENATTDQAVDLTRGWLLMYGGQPADTSYAASDGGYTENSEDVWSQALPYLRGKPDPYDPTGKPGAGWQVTYTNAQLCRQLTGAGYPFASVSGLAATSFTTVGHRIKTLVVTGLSPAGQPESVTIGNADNVRLALGLAAAPFVMTPVFTSGSPASGTNGTSPSATASASSATGGTGSAAAPVLATVTFAGAGDGHGVGLSQEGAEAMAQSGRSYQDILAFYYTGASLVPNYGR